MKKHKTIAQMTQKASSNLVESIYLLRILDDLVDGEGKLCTVINLIMQKNKAAFSNIEQCRRYL